MGLSAASQILGKFYGELLRTRIMWSRRPALDATGHFLVDSIHRESQLLQVLRHGRQVGSGSTLNFSRCRRPSLVRRAAYQPSLNFSANLICAKTQVPEPLGGHA